MGVLTAIRRSKVAAVIISVFDWYPSKYSAAERRLLRKLDLAILIFGSLSFFCRFLGQQSITNAYVSGMREDLKAFGNELNYYKMAYNTAYVTGQIPLMTLQTKGKLAVWLLPTLQISWAIIGFCQSTVTQNWHLYILRALTGFLEASSFGGTHLILGSWYKNDEVFKRAGVWFMGNSLGSMFSGYLQAAAYKNLNGVLGRAGWRWLFVIHGIITLPISFLGFAVWPGLPISRRRWWMTEEEHALAVERIPVVEKEGITWKTFRYTLSRPMWWICVPTYIFMQLTSYWTTYMALWLKSARYPVEMVNVLPTFIDLIRAFSSWLGTTLAGTLSLRGLWTFQFAAMFSACLMLAIWNIPNGVKFVAFYLGGFSGMASPILYTWVNFTLKENLGERGLIISSMMTMGYSTTIWVPLLIYPAVEAPEWKRGYPASAVFQFLMWGTLTFGTWYMARWKTRQADPETPEQQQGKDEPKAEDGDGAASTAETTLAVPTPAAAGIVRSRRSTDKDDGSGSKEAGDGDSGSVETVDHAPQN